MIPISHALLGWFVAIQTSIAALVGLCSSAMVTSLRGGPLRTGLLRDAAYGATTFLIVGVLSTVTPMPRNTVVTYLPGGTKMTSTMTYYQHPIALSYLTAALVPGVLVLLCNRPGR